MVLTPEMLATRQRLYDDHAFYAESVVTIRTKEQKITRLIFNKAQRYLQEVYDRQMKVRGFVRMIILKGRQMGSSTWTESVLYWHVSQREAQRALVVAHDIPTTAAVFAMTKRIHDKMPDLLKPHTGAGGRKELEFDLLDSSYRVATAGGDGIVRGDTVTAAHLSEQAWWPVNSAEDNYSGLMDAIPNVLGTVVIEESTANSYNSFWEHWDKAVKGQSLFEPVFLPWFWDNGYRAPVTPDFTHTPDEEDIVAAHGLDDEQLMFRRYKIAEKGLDLFRQEYPLTADEAFLTSGRPIFHPERIQEMLNAAPKDQLGNAKPLYRMALEDEEWLEHPRGELCVFREYDPKETYYIGADVGMGVQRDYSCAQVLDSHKRQIAVWHSDRINEDQFGFQLDALGRYYNDANLIVERNGPGAVTNRVLSRESNYPNLFWEMAYDRSNDVETPRVGFSTTVKTKPIIIGELRGDIRLQTLELYDTTTLTEMRNFVLTETGKMQADAKGHDDTVIALALANHIHEGVPNPIINTDDDYEILE